MARHGHSFGTDSAERSAPAFAAAFPVAAPAQAPGNITDYNWVGDSGAGGNGDWNTAADWSPAAVPGDSASATFATGNSGYTVTGDATIGAITVDGDGVTFDGAITQNTGVTSTFLTGLDDAYVTLDANSFFSGGNINFADGSLLDVQGILLTTGGTADVVIVEGLSGQAITSSALTVNQLYVQTGGSFTGDVTLNDGGSITLDTSSTFGGDTITLLGSGTIYEALAPGATSGNAGIGDAISIASGGTLTLASDPGVDFAVAGPISGAGDLLINGGTVELTGVNTYTGSTQVQNGTLIADGQGAVPNGLIIVTDGEVITQPDSTGATNFTDSVVAYGTSDTVSAVAGNLLVFSGLSGSFTFIGGAGSDTVVGDAGALSVTGGSVGDLVYGGAGAMSFTGGAGSSTVYGGSGGVTATGGSGGDLIYGTQGQHDVLYSGFGPATLVGGNGAQLFATGSANHRVGRRRQPHDGRLRLHRQRHAVRRRRRHHGHHDHQRRHLHGRARRRRNHAVHHRNGGCVRRRRRPDPRLRRRLHRRHHQRARLQHQPGPDLAVWLRRRHRGADAGQRNHHRRIHDPPGAGRR